MKKILVSLGLCIAAIACDNNSTQQSKQSELSSIAKSGTWRITYYYDTDKDETANYAGYNFTFGDNSKLTAVNGSNTYSGTWSIADSNSNDDTFDDLKFNITFTAPAVLVDISDDWDIMEVSNTRVKLIDVSGGGGGTDYLTFEKN